MNLQVGNTIEVNETSVRVLMAPSFKAHRDTAYYAMKVEVLTGESKGTTGWLTADKANGPWEPAGSGFI